MLENAFAQTAEEVGRGLPPKALAHRQALPSAPHLRLCMPQVLAHYGTDPQHGLTAAQVAEARRLHGRNELAPEPGAGADSWWLQGHCAQLRIEELGCWRSWPRNCMPGRMPWERRQAPRRRRRPCASVPPRFLSSAAGTPFWKLVLKQFDDLLVKVGVENEKDERSIAAAGCRPLRPAAARAAHAAVRRP